MITGLATKQDTLVYARRKFPDRTFLPLGSTGLMVSQAGFGGYRVHVEVDEHREALRQALQSGINLIDTSSNYTDGGSEELVGEVLYGMIEDEEIVREEVVVVSKVGYLQGQNYKLSQERKEAEMPFPDLVEYGEGLEHCIHPVFLQDLLTRSLERLHMQSIDVYLLHNPEYFLGWAQGKGVELERAREEYDRRIELAFRYLEKEVEKGRIQAYGISSNTFSSSADEYAHTSLERVWEIAESISLEHHFRVIQLPMNLLETGGSTEHNQPSGQNVLDFAKSKEIGVLINRPLNAIIGGQLTRLADVPIAPAGLEEELPERLDALQKSEEELHDALLPELKPEEAAKNSVLDKLQLGALLAKYWQSFHSKDHLNDVLGQFFMPTLQKGILELRAIAEGNEQQAEAEAWMERYISEVNGALKAVTAHYLRQAERVVAEIKDRVATADSEWAAAPTLSQMAIRALRSTEGITCVLVGMRREEYVQDVVEELKQNVEVKDRKASWQKLKDAR